MPSVPAKYLPDPKSTCKVPVKVPVEIGVVQRVPAKYVHIVVKTKVPAKYLLDNKNTCKVPVGPWLT